MSSAGDCQDCWSALGSTCGSRKVEEEALKKQQQQQEQQQSQQLMRTMVAAAIGSACATLTLNPINVIKVHLQRGTPMQTAVEASVAIGGKSGAAGAAAAAMGGAV